MYRCYLINAVFFCPIFENKLFHNVHLIFDRQGHDYGAGRQRPWRYDDDVTFVHEDLVSHVLRSLVGQVQKLGRAPDVVDPDMSVLRVAAKKVEDDWKMDEQITLRKNKFLF